MSSDIQTLSAVNLLDVTDSLLQDREWTPGEEGSIQAVRHVGQHALNYVVGVDTYEDCPCLSVSASINVCQGLTNLIYDTMGHISEKIDQKHPCVCYQVFQMRKLFGDRVVEVVSKLCFPVGTEHLKAHVVLKNLVRDKKRILVRLVRINSCKPVQLRGVCPSRLADALLWPKPRCST